MMDAKTFIQTLKSLGFDGADQLNESAVRRMLEDKRAEPFSTWLRENITTFQALTPDELEGYHKLQEDGKAIFELEELATYLPMDEDPAESANKSKPKEDENRRRKAANEEAKHLQKRKNMMSNLLLQMKEKMEGLQKCFEGAKVKLGIEYDRAENAGQKLDEKLDELKASVLRLAEAYRDTDRFLSHLKLDAYFEVEDTFTDALTKYTKKQFFEGIADIAGARDKSRYEILDISNPEQLLLRGEDEKMISQQSKELHRLQSLYARSQRNYLESCCNLKSKEAELHETENQLSEVVLKPVHLSEGSLLKMLKGLEEEITNESAEMLHLIREELLPLLEKLAELENTTILSGNYDLKIARQDYFLSKQDEVINQLIIQSSRYDFLSMLFEIEAKFHRRSYHLLTAIKELIESNRLASEERIQLMGSRYFQKDDTSRETIDSRDTFVCALYDMLVPPTDTKQPTLFKSCEMLQKQGSQLTAEHRETVQNEYVTNQECNALLDALESEVKHCEEMIFGKAEGEGNEMIDLANQTEKLAEVENKVRNSVREFVRDIDTKKKVLSSDSLQEMERTLSSVFFRDPIRFRRLFSELDTRAEGSTDL